MSIIVARTTSASTIGGETPLVLYKENTTTPLTPVALGEDSIALGSGSNTSPQAPNSLAVGKYSLTRHEGAVNVASGRFDATGDAQGGWYVLRGQTTTNTPTELFLDGATKQVTLPSNSVVTFDVLIAARYENVNGQGGGFRITGVGIKDATLGSIALIGTPQKQGSLTNPEMDADVNVDTLTGALTITVTGLAGIPIRWVATVYTAEVAA